MTTAETTNWNLIQRAKAGPVVGTNYINKELGLNVQHATRFDKLL